MALGPYIGSLVGILQVVVIVMLFRELLGVGYSSRGSGRSSESANAIGGSRGSGQSWVDAVQEMAGNGVEKAKDQIADDKELFAQHFDDEVASLIDDYDRAEDAVEELSDLSDTLEKELGAYQSAHPKTAALRTNLAAVLTGIQQAMFDNMGDGEGLDAAVRELEKNVGKSQIDISKLRELLMGEERHLEELEGKEQSRVNIDEDAISTLTKLKDRLEEAAQVIESDDNRGINQLRDAWGEHIQGTLDSIKSFEENIDVEEDYHGLETLEDIENVKALEKALDQMVTDLNSAIKKLNEDIQDAKRDNGDTEKTRKLVEGVQEHLKDLGRLKERVNESSSIIIGTVTGGETEDGSTQPGMINYTKRFDIKGKTKDLRNAEEDPKEIVQEIKGFNAKLANDINTVQIAMNRLEKAANRRNNKIEKIKGLLATDTDLEDRKLDL